MKKRKKKDRKHDSDILEYMLVSQAKRQENEEIERAERREREQERRDRAQRRYEELQADKASNRLRADQMQQMMIQMQHQMMMQQQNFMMLLMPDRFPKTKDSKDEESKES